MNLDEPYGLLPFLNVIFTILSIAATLTIQGNALGIAQLRKAWVACYHVCPPSSFLPCLGRFSFFTSLCLFIYYSETEALQASKQFAKADHVSAVFILTQVE